MSERRKNERRKWGRKVTYPFIDSDGVLVTKNRRRLIDRRTEGIDATEEKAATLKKPVAPTLSDPATSLDISASKMMELEEAIKKEDGPTSKIDTSIKNLESQILSGTKDVADPKIAANGIDPTAAKSTSAQPATAKPEAKPATQPEAKAKPKAEPVTKPEVKPEAKPSAIPEPLTNENKAKEKNGASIELSCQGDKHLLSEKQDTYQVGRDPTCDIIIQGKHVSRAHAKIIYKEGKFFLQDNSFNGTYIKFDNGQKIHVAKNEQTLISSGVMCMGKPVKEGSSSIIQFKIIE